MNILSSKASVFALILLDLIPFSITNATDAVVLAKESALLILIVVVIRSYIKKDKKGMPTGNDFL